MVGWHHQLNGHEIEQALGDRWWRTGKPDVLQSIGSQRLGQNWTIEWQKIDNSKDYLLPLSFHIYKKSVSLIDTSGSLEAQRVNNMTAMWETCVQPLGPKDLQEKGMATHSSFNAWRIHGKRNPEGYSPWCRIQSEEIPQKDAMFSTGCLLNLVQ